MYYEKKAEFIKITLHLGGECLEVYFYPDERLVAFDESKTQIDICELPCGVILKHEDLVDICIRKIEKESK